MTLEIRLLLDENVSSRRLLDYLDDDGHEVQRVEDVDRLGKATADSRILNYCRETDRVLVTADEDFKSVPTAEHEGVLFLVNDTEDAFESYRMLDAVLGEFPDRESLRGRVVHVSEAWL